MKLRATYAVVLVAGCNQFYGLDATHLPSDSLVVGCPDGRAPRFSPAIQQAVPQSCAHYHFNTDGSLATANCSTQVLAGRRDAVLDVPVWVPTPGVSYFDPRPAPEGRRIYARKYMPATPTIQTLVTFDETSSRTWTESGQLPITYSSSHRATNVFRGPTGDRLITINTGTKEMFEYERDGTTWVQRGPTRAIPVRFSVFGNFSLTTDGLRAVYQSDDRAVLLYVSRPDLDSWFGEPVPVEGAPSVDDAQLTNNCARLYYDGLDSIFYSQQE